MLGLFCLGLDSRNFKGEDRAITAEPEAPRHGCWEGLGIRGPRGPGAARLPAGLPAGGSHQGCCSGACGRRAGPYLVDVVEAGAFIRPVAGALPDAALRERGQHDDDHAAALPHHLQAEKGPRPPCDRLIPPRDACAHGAQRHGPGVHRAQTGHPYTTSEHTGPAASKFREILNKTTTSDSFRAS